MRVSLATLRNLGATPNLIARRKNHCPPRHVSDFVNHNVIVVYFLGTIMVLIEPSKKRSRHKESRYHDVIGPNSIGDFLLVIVVKDLALGHPRILEAQCISRIPRKLELL